MRVHRFVPTSFHHAFGTFEPALEIADGDVVETTTLDAAGRDAAGAVAAEPGNPLTGPFRIDGAEPGDTLSVHLEALQPNRRRGFSAASLAPVAVDPEFVPELGLGDARESVDWDVDLEAGVARLLEGVAGLARLSLPLAPMLGCIGVAPARGQAISSATSGPHGGNMDYRLIRAGVTLSFPVSVPGALLFVGDGHALQGAGELAGTGVEISFDVRFRVRLLRGRRIGWPRGEADVALFTIGNARPLDQATQHATTEMFRWLREDFGLGAEAASILIGQAAEYHLGNMFDPAYTMVCRLERALLEGLATDREG
jgi:amidase